MGGTTAIDTLESVFPAVVIDRAMIDEPTALWEDYDAHEDLAALEGKTWLDVPDDWLWRHEMLLVWAGDSLWRAILPAYLRYVLREHDKLNALPWHVAGELSRPGEPRRKIERRLAPLSAAQHAAIRDALAEASTRPRIADAMTRTLATWNES